MADTAETVVIEAPKRRGGRQKGQVALKRQARERLLGKLEMMTVTPLEVMYLTMKDFWDKDEKIAACAIARDLAPYVHPKLTAIQQQIVTDDAQKVADERVFDKLLNALEIGVTMRNDLVNGRVSGKVVAQQTTLVQEDVERE
jgi:hypothetical protein